MICSCSRISIVPVVLVLPVDGAPEEGLAGETAVPSVVDMSKKKKNWGQGKNVKKEND